MRVQLLILIIFFIVILGQVACQSMYTDAEALVTSVPQVQVKTEPTILPTSTPTMTLIPTSTPSSTPTHTAIPTSSHTPTPAVTPTPRNTRVHGEGQIREGALPDAEPTATPHPIVTQSVTSNSLIAVIASRFSGTGWPGCSEVWVIDPATDRNYQLTNRPTCSIAWSPSGQQLVLGIDRALYVIDRDGSNLMLVKRPTPPRVAILGAQWLSDDLILFIEGAPDSDFLLYTISLSSGAVNDFSVEGISNYSSFLVSPNRQFVAFTDYSNRVRTQEGNRITISNTPIRIASISEGQVVASLIGLEGQLIEGHPISWHPDESRLIVRAVGRPSLEGCLLIDIRRLTAAVIQAQKSEIECPFSFSPDGRWIATVHSLEDSFFGDRLVVRSFPITAGIRRLLFGNIGEVTFMKPVWSPFLAGD
jgi:hypothetical protein